MIWEGGRDHDDDRGPGIVEDMACVAFCMLLSVLLPLLLYIIIAPL